MSLILLPVKFLGIAAAGLAFGAGWKLGSYLFDEAIANREILQEKASKLFEKLRAKEPIWKRQFSKVSEE
jgi:hypothetical protein